ncbi:hypothetical protein PIB30_087612, partial [Stylosanthes scabra]|nr:hypothetical protein [Stylosanthes scabra]
KYQEQAPTLPSLLGRTHHHHHPSRYLSTSSLPILLLLVVAHHHHSYLHLLVFEKFLSLHSGRLGLLEKLDVRPSSRILRQPSKLEPVPEKFDNVRSENPQPMDSQYR